jgi:Coenzyme PQQ synthesis protein D (PqqD)
MSEHGSIAAEARISRKPRVVYRDLAEGGVLLDLESGDYHGLNSTGAAIWKLLEAETNFADLLQRFEGVVDDPPPAVRDHVTRFVDGLRQSGLVIVREA